MSESREHLHIYLQDHAAGSQVGMAMVERAAENNEGSELGAFLEQLTREIAADQQALHSIMDAVGASRSQLKEVVANIGEKAGRLKPNNQLTGYSPLSRVVELEGLLLGVSGKRALWEALDAVSASYPELDAAEIRRLHERAEAQVEGLRIHRLQAVTVAMETERAVP
ncbi:MAG: hypothetical protein H0U42_00725 [Thermoleophilaceae bacterium]|nr:hypothetical protein [Thermoleophilaceae bacterium]